MMKRIYLLALATSFLVACSPADPPLTAVPPQKVAPVSMAPAPVPAAKPAPPPPPPPQPVVVQKPEIKFPLLSDVAAVVFEDRFPKVGDGDFNDFLTNFKIVEKINEKNQITDIIIDFYPRAVGGSYDHSFLMSLNGMKDQPSNITLKTTPLFNGDAKVTLTHYDQHQNVINTEEITKDEGNQWHDVTIFKSTHSLFSGNPGEIINTCTSASKTCPKGFASKPYEAPLQSARLSIHIVDASLSENPIATTATAVDTSKFRMILHVKNTNKDIDIIDVDPSNFDSSGYPYGFIIPADWRWPAEGINIVKGYGKFTDYRLYLLSRATNAQAPVADDVAKWYDNPTDTTVLYHAVPGPKLLPDP